MQVAGVSGAPNSRTQVVGVIGDPVLHSLSPLIHNAAFAALGLDWVYVAFPVAAGRASDALAGAKALGVRGLSVTMPHKEGVAVAADERSEVVERLGAANTVVVRHGLAVAESTDGAGLLADLADEAGFDPAGRRCLVIGAGGAARSAVLALAEAGASEVVVVNRTARRAERAAALAGRAGRVGTRADLGEAELVVKATPPGMTGVEDEPAGGSPGERGGVEGVLPGADTSGGRGASGGELLGPGQLAVDLVYAPATTPFLDAARSRGATARNGLGMLVRQAALQLELWTGERAPLQAMWDAARGAVPPLGN